MFFLINAEKKKGIIYSKIDDWPREITFIVTVRKCLVEVFANNEYSGLRQVTHIVVKPADLVFSSLISQPAENMDS